MPTAAAVGAVRGAGQVRDASERRLVPVGCTWSSRANRMAMAPRVLPSILGAAVPAWPITKYGGSPAACCWCPAAIKGQSGCRSDQGIQGPLPGCLRACASTSSSKVPNELSAV